MNPPAPIPRLLTLDEAAEHARRSPKAMRQIRQRQLHGEVIGPRFRKIAGRVYVAEHDLLTWLEGDSQ